MGGASRFEPRPEKQVWVTETSGTAKRLGAELGVGKDTIQQDGAFAAAVDSIAATGSPEAAREIRSGKALRPTSGLHSPLNRRILAMRGTKSMITELLRQYPRLFRATRTVGFLAVRTAKRASAAVEIRRHLAHGDPVRVILGAGTHRRPGWLSTDIEIRHPSVVFLDVTKRFPIADGAVDAYFLEHMIEHISFEAGSFMLGEIHRTISPTGVARIATPDLCTVKRLLDRSDDQSRAYARKANAGWERYHVAGSPCPSVPDDEIDNPVFAINRLFYGWHHRFIYDEPTLGRALERCDFHWRRCSVGQSEHAHLRGIEHHGELITAEINDFETMVVEASKARPDGGPDARGQRFAAL